MIISLYWFVEQYQTSKLRQQKLGFFSQNLVRNLMNLVLMIKIKKKNLKNV